MLRPFERRALAALADALVPRGGAVYEGASDVGVAGELDRWLSSFTPSARRMVRAMVVGFELSPLLSRRPRLFHQLDDRARSAWCAASDRARFRPRREALQGLQSLVQMAYASHPRVAEAIGYDGLPLLPVDWDQVAPTMRLPILQYPDAPVEADTDVVVIGSGAGGAVAAEALARAGLRVVILEEGGLFNRDDFAGRRPAERLIAVYRDNGLTFTLGSPTISLPMGRAVGGTTVVNSGTCFRTPEDVLHTWSLQGIPAVAPEDMAPWFDRVEDVIGVRAVPEEVLGTNGEIFRRGAAALGFSGGPIRRNIRGCHGHGVCAFGCPLDAKQAMHVTYLPKAVEAGATIIAHARVRRVWLENGRAVGVVADVLEPGSRRRRGELKVRARAVVVAAGAVFTPALLLRQRLAVSSGQLGRNLVIHPGGGTTARFEEELTAWRGTMQSWYVDERLRDGILLEATFPPPGIGYSAGSLPGWGEGKELFRLYPHMASCGSIVSDAGNGRVRPVGRHGALIRYDLSTADARKVLEGIALAAEIFFAAGAKAVYPMLPGLAEISSSTEIARIRSGRWRPAELHLSAYHPMGTARLGTDRRHSVADPWGAVWDVPGLWVLDASILPSSTHVNPQVTIMAMAGRGASRLADVLT